MRDRAACYGFIAALLATWASPVWAAPENDYVALRTAIEIDRACEAFKYMEFTTVRGLASKHLERTIQYTQSRNGQMSLGDFDAWRVSLDDKARLAAAAVGCGQGAASYVLTAKAAAAEELYRGLILAFALNSLPPHDLNRVAIDPYQNSAAAGYEAYLRELYGQSFEDFAERQRKRAAELLPEGSQWTSQADVAKVWSAQAAGMSAITAVQFEVAAEGSGHRVRPYDFSIAMTGPSLRAAGREEVLPIVRGPGYQLVRDGDELIELHSVSAMLSDRRIRVMFYGQTAATRMTSPTVRLYVRQPPYPDGASAPEIFRDGNFHRDALAFEGTKSPETCFGAPCYDFPLDATEALLANPIGDYAELFVSLSPFAQPPAIGFSTAGRAPFSNQWMLWWLDNR